MDTLIPERTLREENGMEKKADELAWKAFEESGDIGAYMLYKALKETPEKE